MVFEDESILVVDKPAGMVVNKAETTRGEETVQDWLEGRNSAIYCAPGRRLKSATPFFERTGIVHRLDKETSGLLLIAKTPEAFLNLQSQFKNRQVKKKYLALVHGRVVPEEGEIRAPVGRLPWNRERFGVIPGGREAVTKYKVIATRDKDGFWVVSRGWEVWVRKNFPQLPPTTLPTTHNSQLALLELIPLTGRTHQIRVHLKYLGHPIVGDSFYAGRKRAREDRKFCPRLFLHANFLEFNHPVNGKRLSFESPLPDELSKVCKT